MDLVFQEMPVAKVAGGGRYLSAADYPRLVCAVVLRGQGCCWRNTEPAQCVCAVPELQQPPALLLQAVAQGIAPGMLTPEMARMAASQMSSLSPDQVEQMAANLPPEQMRQFAAMTQSGPGMAGSAGGGTQVG